jgi:Zn-dependent protease with chaperone function
MHDRVVANHQRLLGTDLHASGARRLAGNVLALLVHLVTLLLVVGGVWIWTTGTFFVAKLIASVLLLGVAWEARPRLGRIPTGDDVRSRMDAPNSFAVLDAVAQATGSPTPDLLVVSPQFNASIGRAGWRGRRVLTIGLPLWSALDDRQRVAVLGHECGHEVNGDLRSTVVVGTAITTLSIWSWLLRPDVRATQRRWRQGTTGGSLNLFIVAEYLVPLILLPLSVTIGLLALGLHRIAARSGQRAEYRADELAAVAAGTDTTVATLDQFFCGNSLMHALMTALGADRNADVWAAEQRFLDSVTPSQRERWRRIAAREQHRTDASHPPTLLRQEMLLSRPKVEGKADVPTHLMAAMTAELGAFAPTIARQLRDAERSD